MNSWENRSTIGGLHFCLPIFLMSTGLVACGGQGQDDYPTAHVSVTSDTLVIPRGGDGSFIFNVIRETGHRSDVNFAFAPTPPGINAAFLPPVVDFRTTASNGAISVGAGVPAGYYQINATASGDFPDQSSRNFRLIIKVEEPGVALLVDPPFVSVEQGDTVQAQVSMTRSGEYRGEVFLKMKDLPPGMIASIAPQYLVGSTTTSTVRLTPSLAVAPGSYQVFLEGAGTGGVTSTVPVTANVAPTSVPSVLVLVDSAAATLGAGMTARIPIRIIRLGGFAGEVNLEVSGLPSSVTGQLTPVKTSGDNAELEIAASSYVLSGGHYITITVSSPSARGSSATFLLHLIAVGG